MVKVKDVLDAEGQGEQQSVEATVEKTTTSLTSTDIEKKTKLKPGDEWIKDWDSWVERSEVELHFNKDWKIYFINSDNEKLLVEYLNCLRLKIEKLEKMNFKMSLPIQTIYQLLDAFYPYWYEFIVWDMREVGEYITTDKWKNRS